MAIRTMEVGVETFSLTLKSRERTENEQMSTPLPATELKMPPRKPTARRTAACQAPNLNGQKYGTPYLGMTANNDNGYGMAHTSE